MGTMKPHEISLARLVMANDGRVPSSHWEALTKRDLAVLEKWWDRDWWDCGVSVRSGWVTEAGKIVLAKRAALEGK